MKHLKSYKQINESIFEDFISQSKPYWDLEDEDYDYIIDTQGLIKYMKAYGLKEINLEELIKNIDWNIILPKK